VVTGPVVLPADVELVVVSFRSRAHLEVLLASWPVGTRVAVVDNSPGAEPLADLVDGHPGRRLVADGPGGYAAGINLAVAGSTAEHLVFVNPDSRPGVEVLTALVADLRADPSLAGVGALPVLADGTPEIGAGGWRPTLRRTLVHATGLHRRHPTAGLIALPTVGEPIELDWVCGAVFAVRRSTFTALGGLPEDYHVYSEDLDYGLGALSRGLRVRLRTDLPVRHDAGTSGAPRAYGAWLRGRAQAWWYRDNTGATVARLSRVALALGSLARVPLYLSRRRPALAAEARWYARALVRPGGPGPGAG